MPQYRVVRTWTVTHEVSVDAADVTEAELEAGAMLIMQRSNLSSSPYFMEVEQMSNTIKLDLGALAGECEDWFELQIEVDYEVDAYDKGDWTTPPSGGGIHIFHCWLGIGDKKVDILGALDSLDLDLHETIMEALEPGELEQEPDADHAYELARDREMGL